MPSLRTLDVVHRLNAPTRAAATRRRRLRKANAVAAFLCAAAMLAPKAPADRPPQASQEAPGAGAVRAGLAGRHALVLRSATAVPPHAQRVDVWNEHGARLISCAPVLPSPETGSSLGNVTSSTLNASVAAALTSVEVSKIAQYLHESTESESNLVITVCL